MQAPCALTGSKAQPACVAVAACAPRMPVLHRRRPNEPWCFPIFPEPGYAGVRTGHRKPGLAGVPPSAGAARLVNEARKSHSRCRLLRCFFVPFAAVVRRSQESLKAKHHAATGNAYQMMKRTPTQLAKPLSRSNAECLEKTLGRLYPVLVEGIGGGHPPH